MVNDYCDKDNVVKLLEALTLRVIVVPNTYGSGGHIIVITGGGAGQEQIIEYAHGSLE